MAATRIRAAWATTLAVSLALTMTAAAPAATATPLGRSLLADAGAELAAGTDGSTSVPVPGWTLDGGFTAAAYGATNCPAGSESTRIGGGAQLFYGGNAAVAHARQRVTLRGRSAAIDKGRIKVSVAAWIAGYAAQPDNGRVMVRFLRANGSQIGRIQTAAVGGTNGVLQRVTAAKALPKGTRILEVVLVATRLEGAWNDAFFDNVDLRIRSV